MPKKILVLFAHPNLDNSRVQVNLLRAIEGLGHVTIRDLYELYPNFNVDVAAEQAQLVAHDIIVWQFPLYWYSVPPLLKQWIDLVLEHGWAYGANGHHLTGKWILVAASSGGGMDAYTVQGFHQHTFHQFLLPLRQTALLCHMHWLPPFVVHGAHRLSLEQIEAAARDYRKLLSTLIEPHHTPDALHQHYYLNHLVNPPQN